MFQKYKYILAVYQEQSFTKAAKSLSISQPSLSVAVRNVETMLGMPLFERHGSGIKATELGEAYIAAAEKMQLAEDEFEKKHTDINGLQIGRLSVGGSNYLSSDVLPQIITRFRDRYPGVEITLTEANSVHLREMLMNEEIDIVIDNFDEKFDMFEMYPLINERILLCVPVGREINNALQKYQILPEHIYCHPDCTEAVPAVNISVFADEKFILLKNGNDMYHRALKIFEEDSMIPKVVFYVDQLNISCALSESGLGACFMTDTFFKYRKHAGDVILYKINTELGMRKLAIAHKKSRYCTTVMTEFIKITQEIIRYKTFRV